MAFPDNPAGWKRAKAAGYVVLLDGHTEARNAMSVTNLIW